MRVIGGDGQQLGIMSSSLRSGLRRRAKGFSQDLAYGKSAVCKIMDYGKFKFELAKKEKESRKNQKMVELKEVQLSMTIDTNDLNVKARQAQKFLDGGNKVKVAIKMRGRQNAHAVLGFEVMNKFFDILNGAVMDKKPAVEGRTITMFLSPSKQ